MKFTKKQKNLVFNSTILVLLFFIIAFRSQIKTMIHDFIDTIQDSMNIQSQQSKNKRKCRTPLYKKQVYSYYEPVRSQDEFENTEIHGLESVIIQHHQNPIPNNEIIEPVPYTTHNDRLAPPKTAVEQLCPECPLYWNA